MNQANQYIFNLYHYLLNLRDTMEYALDRNHSKDLYNQRKEVLTKGTIEGSALGNFFANNEEQGKKIQEKIDEFIKEVYGDDSTILKVTDDGIRVDHTQNMKILDYVTGISESIRDIVYGYLGYAKGQGQEDPEIVKLVDLDDKLYRTVHASIAFNEFKKSFGEFQKVMGESQGKATPQSNFIVQNEIVKLSGMIRFSRSHHHCTDNATLDILDELNAVIEMTEGRRDRRNDRSFKDLFDEVGNKLNAHIASVEPAWKDQFSKVMKTYLEETRAKVEA